MGRTGHVAGPDSDKVEAEITVPMECLRVLVALAACAAWVGVVLMIGG